MEGNLKSNDDNHADSGNSNKLVAANRTIHNPAVSYDVHIFYYAWYGNPENDAKYIHWNHQYLKHWESAVAERYKKYSGRHAPPDDIGANFYPFLGPYSSWNKTIIQDHMKQIQLAGAGVVVLSWYPPGKSDPEGKPSDSAVLPLLLAADEHNLKITFHIEPYKDRTPDSVRNDIKYIIDTYGHYPSFYKRKWKGQQLPLIYVYDSYHIKPKAWKEVLTREGTNTIRGTKYDAIVIALLVDEHHKSFITTGGFDGFYTYFAADGFTYGSRKENWKNLKQFSLESSSIFIPSVGPGYIDTRVRPWNSQNTRNRLNGDYYDKGMNHALEINPSIISITSFNEWHEGTQIEKAVHKEYLDFKYLDYSPQEPDFYLKLTRKWVHKFMRRKRVQSL
ncbi:uncharacterized protein TRIADDRAFT_31721 [Trichoplax adhaerens]|uniref:Mannosidase endo-alpha n=1 Tax=Trichoplax adhaerens TaxID=10228 RepID=B3S9T5_TRIAD|nr:hypothetical protein TRIADDRAFT_31721 [Trichoplax adhaerens]EDV20528.1 hypothetical protein TRIADDRAFT_31721 [Trichoplax adhaerens]|eukprot:XP_002116954.1 hypothetical protein TRIADDRAFT_31721 [Trichoplax adhaerens]